MRFTDRSVLLFFILLNTSQNTSAAVSQRKNHPKTTGGVQVHHHAVGTCSHSTCHLSLEDSDSCAPTAPGPEPEHVSYTPPSGLPLAPASVESVEAESRRTTTHTKLAVPSNRCSRCSAELHTRPRSPAVADAAIACRSSTPRAVRRRRASRCVQIVHGARKRHHRQEDCPPLPHIDSYVGDGWRALPARKFAGRTNHLLWSRRQSKV